ncbi:unnamed protein product [Acanthosepion pharaonis]|uniref:Uncharacterized protein n=1 Tax=Acanthosepion pharaonis TaxID=158019 RepID=A0A812CSH7_ACAPH|nr:unnamed protein product [Sepia pharaonis]
MPREQRLLNLCIHEQSTSRSLCLRTWVNTESRGCCYLRTPVVFVQPTTAFACNYCNRRRRSVKRLSIYNRSCKSQTGTIPCEITIVLEDRWRPIVSPTPSISFSNSHSLSLSLSFSIALSFSFTNAISSCWLEDTCIACKAGNATCVGRHDLLSLLLLLLLFLFLLIITFLSSSLHLLLSSLYGELFFLFPFISTLHSLIPLPEHLFFQLSPSSITGSNEEKTVSQGDDDDVGDDDDGGGGGDDDDDSDGGDGDDDDDDGNDDDGDDDGNDDDDGDGNDDDDGGNGDDGDDGDDDDDDDGGDDDGDDDGGDDDDDDDGDDDGGNLTSHTRKEK